MRVITVTPVIGAAIYVAGDAVGGLLTFPSALGGSFKRGEVIGLTIVDRAAQDAALILQLFDRTFTATADHDAYDPSDADIANAIANIPVLAGDYFGGVSNSVATVTPKIPVDALGGDLFGQLFTPDTPTYGAVDALTVKLFMRD